MRRLYKVIGIEIQLGRAKNKDTRFKRKEFYSAEEIAKLLKVGEIVMVKVYEQREGDTIASPIYDGYSVVKRTGKNSFQEPK